MRVGCFDLMRSAEFMLVGLVGSSGLLVFCLLFWVCVGLFVGCFNVFVSGCYCAWSVICLVV